MVFKERGQEAWTPKVMRSDPQPRGDANILRRIVNEQGIFGRNGDELQCCLEEGWIGLGYAEAARIGYRREVSSQAKGLDVHGQARGGVGGQHDAEIRWQTKKQSGDFRHEHACTARPELDGELRSALAMSPRQPADDQGAPVFVLNFAQDDLLKERRSECNAADLGLGDFVLAGPIRQIGPLPEDTVEVDQERFSHGRSVGKVYRGRFVSTRLAATLLADGAPCFAICACPALVINRDCSYISIHFSLEIAAISSPIASSGKSSGDSK